MELIRKNKDLWDPLDLITDLQSDLNRAFNRSLSRGGNWGSSFEPSVEIREDENHFVVHADVPGLEKKDIQVMVEGRSLILKGERKQEKESKTKGYHYSERFYGSFMRALELPTEIDAAKIKAAYQNGVLEVTLPKSENAKPKQIDIEVK